MNSIQYEVAYSTCKYTGCMTDTEECTIHLDIEPAENGGIVIVGFEELGTFTTRDDLEHYLFHEDTSKLDDWIIEEHNLYGREACSIDLL